jgi:hypothetical protein
MTSRLRHQVAMTMIMWGAVVLFGLPGLALAWLSDSGRLPLAVGSVIVGIAVATVTTVLIYRRCRSVRTHRIAQADRA